MVSLRGGPTAARHLDAVPSRCGRDITVARHGDPERSGANTSDVHRGIPDRIHCLSRERRLHPGRQVTRADTTFAWASGAPVGLLADPWNVRLIPHYSLAVWFVSLHMGIGLRAVLLAHGVSAAAANRVAWAVGILGVALAIPITVAQLGVHGADGQRISVSY